MPICCGRKPLNHSTSLSSLENFLAGSAKAEYTEGAKKMMYAYVKKGKNY